MIFITGASSENVDDIVSSVFNTYLGTVGNMYSMGSESDETIAVPFGSESKKKNSSKKRGKKI